MTCRKDIYSNGKKSCSAWMNNAGISTITNEDGEVDFDPSDATYHALY